MTSTRVPLPSLSLSSIIGAPAGSSRSYSSAVGSVGRPRGVPSSYQKRHGGQPSEKRVGPNSRESPQGITGIARSPPGPSAAIPSRGVVRKNARYGLGNPTKQVAEASGQRRLTKVKPSPRFTGPFQSIGLSGLAHACPGSNRDGNNAHDASTIFGSCLRSVYSHLINKPSTAGFFGLLK